MPKTRNVLDGVPRVGFYPHMQQHADSRMRCPEDVPLPSVMRSCLEYLRDPAGCLRIGLTYPRRNVGCGYALLMGVTGAAFRLSWKEGWHGDNAATWLVGNDAGEVFRRAFAAMGWQLEIVHLDRDRPDDMTGRDKIIQSIDAGRPVIAHGVVGPPEECIVTGYDEGGEVLVGWSFFQIDGPAAVGLEYEPCGYFRKRNWRPDTWSLLLFGQKEPRPPEMPEVYRQALRWALEVIRTPRRFDRHNGLAAFDAWMEHLGRQEQIVEDPAKALEVHDDAVLVIAEGRWYGSIFLSEAARVLPGPASDLLTAAAACADSHALMWKVWGVLGGNGRGAKQQQALQDPARRAELLPLLEAAKDNDRRCAEHIAAALESIEKD
jgi:hypothetical protein